MVGLQEAAAATTRCCEPPAGPLFYPNIYIYIRISIEKYLCQEIYISIRFFLPSIKNAWERRWAYCFFVSKFFYQIEMGRLLNAASLLSHVCGLMVD